MTPRTTAHVPSPVARLMERCTPTGLAMFGIALTVASLLGFAALQYAMPDRTDRDPWPGSDDGRPRTSGAAEQRGRSYFAYFAYFARRARAKYGVRRRAGGADRRAGGTLQSWM